MELVQTAESIAEEKGIEKELVFDAIEKAISKAGKVKYGNDYDIRGNIDRKTGKISLSRYLEVKKDVEDNLIEISLKDAKKKQKGDYIESNFNYGLTLNRLNQNFQPSSGYKTTFAQTLPIYADDMSVVNSLNVSRYFSPNENAIFSLKFLAELILYK